MIKGCIFDLDGVLVDTAHYHYKAWRSIANDLGFDITHEQNEQLKGISRMESLDIILKIGNVRTSDEHKQELADKKNAIYLELISKMTPSEILPGTKEFLSELKAKGLAIALGSASKNAVTILEKTNLISYFDAIIDGTKVSLSKPEPEVFLKAAAELKLLPTECIVFEDAIAGVEAAHRGGMKCIGIGEQHNLPNAELVVPSLQSVSYNTLISLN